MIAAVRLAGRLGLLAVAWCGGARAQDAGPEGVVRFVCPATQIKATAFAHRSGRLVTTDSALGICQNVFVTLETDGPVRARVVARDPYSDLALLLPAQPLSVRPLALAARPDLVAGTTVRSWGFPVAYSGAAPLLNRGYISGSESLAVTKDREVTKVIVGGLALPGLTGSPLVDASGAVVGVISGRLSPLSDGARSALLALKRDASMTFVLERPDGLKETLSVGQIVALVLDEMQLRAQVLIGVATPLDELERFLKNNGIDP